MCEKYNGWNNYETWLVNLWLTDDQSTAEELQRIVHDEDLDLSDKIGSLKEFVDMIIYPDVDGLSRNGLAADLLNAAVSSVDWYEIVTNHLDD